MLMHSMGDENEHKKSINKKIKLPEPKYDSKTSVEKALLKRRSVRAFKNDPLTLADVSQIVWAAQGITIQRMGLRTAPSAGALYPLDLFVVIGNVSGVTKAVYKYDPHKHELIKIRNGDIRDDICIASLGQSWIGQSAIVIVVSAVYERTTQKYGDRGIRYVHMEAGHAAQNIYLQAVSLNLGTAVVGAFNDEKVRKILNMSKEEHPLYIIPIGEN
ncbi:MAG: SagB/ThcOx family dehydrogenase [Spirochaetota bacterium]|nr:SagB/ThcOx family dehydrogenase [Spirochaetota bacterium]